MIFEIGKCYRHHSGEEMKIVGKVNSTMWGNCLVGETNRANRFTPIGKDETNTANWHEITEEEWMKNFS